MQLCSLDVLSLSDHPEGDQERVYDQFKGKLIQRPDGKLEAEVH